jgi:hypothetical protein
MLTSISEKEKKSRHTCLQACCFLKLSPMYVAEFFSAKYLRTFSSHFIKCDVGHVKKMAKDDAAKLISGQVTVATYCRDPTIFAYRSRIIIAHHSESDQILSEAF